MRGYARKLLPLARLLASLALPLVAYGVLRSNFLTPNQAPEDPKQMTQAPETKKPKNQALHARCARSVGRSLKKITSKK